mmetsp:Transcript_21877/g.55839  ORF Transcript_21877/g.55839 Transcript_21877/m.55839 type:complete len:260 (+) Transcript_21877:1100-1879(+)
MAEPTGTPERSEGFLWLLGLQLQLGKCEQSGDRALAGGVRRLRHASRHLERLDALLRLLGTLQEGRTHEVGGRRARELAVQQGEDLFALVRLVHVQREECRVAQERQPLRRRQLLGERVRQVRLVLLPRIEEVALATNAQHVVGSNGEYSGVEVGLEGKEGLVGLLRRGQIAQALVHVRSLRCQHAQLHLDLLLGPVITIHGLAANGDGLLQQLFGVSKLTLPDGCARVIVHKLMRFGVWRIGACHRPSIFHGRSRIIR